MCNSSLQDLRTRGFYVALLGEYLGTLLLVLVGCGAAQNVGVSSLHIALAFGLSVAGIVWSIASASGGHINPAVTAGFLVCRRISLARASLYMAMQTVGAITGAALLKVVTPTSSFTINTSLGALSLGSGITTGQGFLTELLVTFIFVFIIFSAVDSGRDDIGGSVPLTIGLTITMCHLWAIPFTGSGMNPARSFGPALITGKWDDHWLYWAGPLLGGMLGGLLYDFLFASNANISKFKGFFTINYDNDNYDKTGNRASITDATEMKP